MFEIIFGCIVGAAIGWGGMWFWHKVCGLPILVALGINCSIILLLLSTGNAEASEVVANTVTPSVTLQQSLVEIIQQVSSGVSAGVSFLQAEVPDVIRQLLVWKLTEAVLTAVICTLAVLAYIWGAFKTYKISEEDNDPFLFTMFMIFGTIAGIFFSVFSYFNTLEALKIWIAPKVWLIEYAASLVK